ncbi:MAG TPA: hypothetical protein V6D50_14565 [Chroococcales cyanobacterium]|jgi:hypothetical protein
MKINDIAQHYITAPAYAVPYSVVMHFRQFILDLAQVELQGINCHYVDFQPYLRHQKLCLDNICTDVEQGHLLVSTQFNESKLLGSTVNLIFRAIHDIHHARLNVDFSWQGECASARYIMSLTKNFLFQQLLFSEILGQSAVCLYTGMFPDEQKVVLFEPTILHHLMRSLEELDAELV